MGGGFQRGAFGIVGWLGRWHTKREVHIGWIVTGGGLVVGRAHGDYYCGWDGIGRQINNGLW